jgi:hypothetical protein
VRQKGKIDFQKLAKAVGGPGIDPRTWVSYGIVCTITDDGQPNYVDPKAIFVAPDGVWADVLLVPSDTPVTARVQLGVGGKKAQINCPIEPGDQVLVILPEGLMSNALTIVAILNNQAAQLGLDDESKPQFKNDRLSIYVDGIPIELRTKSGATVRMEVDGEVSMVPASGKFVKAGATADGDLEFAARGDTIKSFMDSVKTWLDTHIHSGVTTGAGVSGPPPAVPPPGLSPSVPDVTSSNVKVKK